MDISIQTLMVVVPVTRIGVKERNKVKKTMSNERGAAGAA